MNYFLWIIPYELFLIWIIPYELFVMNYSWIIIIIIIILHCIDLFYNEKKAELF